MDFLPPVSQKSYDKAIKTIGQASTKIAKESMIKAALEGNIFIWKFK